MHVISHIYTTEKNFEKSSTENGLVMNRKSFQSQIGRKCITYLLRILVAGMCCLVKKKLRGSVRKRNYVRQMSLVMGLYIKFFWSF